MTKLADPKEFFRQRREAKSRGESVAIPSTAKPRTNRNVPRHRLGADDRRHAEDFRLIMWDLFVQAIRLGVQSEQFPKEHRAITERQCQGIVERIKAMHGVDL